MTLNFVKYQGTGNDFVLVDNRTGVWQAFLQSQIPKIHTDEKSLVAHLCDRRFGIGGDGLMLLQNKGGVDFEMVYFNSDGGLSTMCGNGGKCIAAWAFSLGLGGDSELSFWAPDGLHKARKVGELIALDMNDVTSIVQIDNNDEHSTDRAWELNTGSPHYVSLQYDAIEDLNLLHWAKVIRYGSIYRENGINVNAINIINNNQIRMRTYERGVEDETLSCGTGVCAAAIAYVHQLELGTTHVERNYLIEVTTPGGVLEVSLRKTFDGYRQIVLIGPATFVFAGEF